MAILPKAQAWIRRNKKNDSVDPLARAGISGEIADTVEEPDDNEPVGPNVQIDRRYDREAMLAEEQEAQIAIKMAIDKQQKLRAIQARKQELQTQLSELEDAIVKFKRSPLRGLFAIFTPALNQLLNELVDTLKKGMENLDDKARARNLRARIVLATTIMALLKGLKLIAAFLDAVYIDKLSCGKACLFSAPTIFFPILILFISPIWILFLGTLFFIGSFPLFKGQETRNIITMMSNLKKQKDAWQIELDRIKKRPLLKKELQKMEKMEKQISKK